MVEEHIRNAERYEIMAELSEGAARERLLARAAREWKIVAGLLGA
jgi:hypothetical protein